jgi:hypothetical protein
LKRNKGKTSDMDEKKKRKRERYNSRIPKTWPKVLSWL